MEFTQGCVVFHTVLDSRSRDFVEWFGASDPPKHGGFNQPYLAGEKRIEDVESDPHYLGAVRQWDGALLVFKDRSTLLFNDLTDEQAKRLQTADENPT